MADNVGNSRINRGVRYWLGAGTFLVLSYFATPLLDEYSGLSEFRYLFFQKLIELSPRPITPRNVKLVLVGDDEYWRGKLAGRAPIKRDYVAELITAVNDGNPRLIAVDFDVRLPDPSTIAIPEDYRKESEVLIATLLKIAEKRPVVLSINVKSAGAGKFSIDPHLYQVFGICSKVDSNGVWTHDAVKVLSISARAARNISCGYIELPYDLRVIPPRLKSVDGGMIDSLALAIAKRKNPELARTSGGAMSFASYIRKEKLDAEGVTLAASGVRKRDEALMDALANEMVIVGGDWSSFASGRGPRIDSQLTPVGAIPGAMVHANYVEAILDNRTYPRVPSLAIKIAEVAIGVLAALFFAIWTTVPKQLFAILGLSAVLVVAQWALVHLFGIFFEAFVPVLAVWLHSLFEPWIGRLIGGSEEASAKKNKPAVEEKKEPAAKEALATGGES